MIAPAAEAAPRPERPDLAPPPDVLPRRPRARLHHGERRQRRGRHRDVLDRGRALRVLAPLDAPPDHAGPHRRAGDVRAPRRDHGQGPRRAPPRELRPADDVLPHGRAPRDGHREHGRRVRGLGGGARDLRRPALGLRPDRGVRRLVARREGQLQDGREDLPHRLHRLPHVRRLGALREARLDGRPQADVRAAHRVERRLDPHDHRHRRHDDRALDAVLPAVLDRREAHRARGIPPRRAGTSSWAASSPRASRSSSSSPAARRSTRRESGSRAPSRPRSRSSRSPESGRGPSSRSASRTPRSSRRRSCPSRPRIPSATGSASRRESTRAGARRPSSTPSTRS